jgi:hypothetical protein
MSATSPRCASKRTPAQLRALVLVRISQLADGPDAARLTSRGKPSHGRRFSCVAVRVPAGRRTVGHASHPRTSLWSSRSLFPRKVIFGGRDRTAITSVEAPCEKSGDQVDPAEGANTGYFAPHHLQPWDACAVNGHDAAPPPRSVMYLAASGFPAFPTSVDLLLYVLLLSAPGSCWQLCGRCSPLMAPKSHRSRWCRSFLPIQTRRGTNSAAEAPITKNQAAAFLRDF